MDSLFEELNSLVIKHDNRATEGRIYVYTVSHEVSDPDMDKARKAFGLSTGLDEANEDDAIFDGMSTPEEVIDYADDECIQWLMLPPTQVMLHYYDLDEKGERTGKPKAVVIPRAEWQAQIKEKQS